ncbi:MAG: hypothetical protein V4735_01110 [Pseudomonadota bacterium]
MLLISAGAAYAQVCKEANPTNSSGTANLDCDMTYRDTVVACTGNNPGDIAGTGPSCPRKPMPMIQTTASSYISDYSPYLFAYPRDPDDANKPYSGAFGIGTQGDANSNYQLFGNSADGATRLASCTAQITVPNPTTGNPTEDAKLARLQLDNCTNQYILNSAMYPFQKENVQLLAGDDPSNPNKRISLADSCQPLRTTNVTANEYSPSDYLKVAWIKTLQDPGYRKTTGVFKNIPCVATGIPCDREPHLPDGVTINNPIAPPDPFPDVPLSSLAAVKYEEIIDPTHPFSPRWDFLLTDREYSKPAMSWADAAAFKGVIANYVAMQTYMSNTDNAVFCAGIKKADGESDQKKKNDLLVPVDVLEFRRKAFENGLFRRTVYNTACYAHKELKPTLYDFVGLAATAVSFCYYFYWTGNIWNPPYVAFEYEDCWTCFGLFGKVDDEIQHPPCTTNYLGSDGKMWLFPGGLNLYSRTALCNYPLQPRKGEYAMDKLCRDLRKPYTQMNRLKMRYHNPDDANDPNGDNVVLKDGVAEGFSFKEYFGNHMPYPRLWDTGTALQKTNSSDSGDQPPLDTTGQYTAIVGIGREAAAKSAATPAAQATYTDQRCLAGGWGGPAPHLPFIKGVPTSFGGVKIYMPDPISSWTETKLYQTRALRSVGLSCLVRYEKIYKPGGAENMLMLAAGGEWSQILISKCPRTGPGRTGNCQYMSLKDYADSGSPANDNSTIYMKQLEKQAWPNSWRGYMASPVWDNQFPNFGGPGTPGGSASGLTATLAGQLSNAATVAATNAANQAVNSATGAVTGTINGATRVAVNAAGQVINTATGTVMGTVNGAVGQANQMVMTTTGQIVNSTTGAIVGNIRGATGQLTGTISGFTNSITAPVTNAIGEITSAQQNVTNTVNGAVNTITAPITEVTGQINGTINEVNGTINGVNNTINGVTNTVNGAVNTVNNTVNTVNNVTNTVNNVTNTVNNVANGIGNVSGAVSTVTNGISGVTGAVSGVTSGISGITGGITGSLTGMTGALTGITGSLSGITSTLSGLTGTLSSLTSGLGSITSSISGFVSGFAGNAMSGMLSFIGFDGFLSAFSAVSNLSSIYDMISNLGGSVLSGLRTSITNFASQTLNIGGLGTNIVAGLNNAVAGAGTQVANIASSVTGVATGAIGSAASTLGAQASGLLTSGINSATSALTGGTATLMAQAANLANQQLAGTIAGQLSVLGDTATYSFGLDKAQKGDIVLMPYGPNNNPIRPGLAKLAMVIEVNLPGTSDCATRGNCYVKVLEPDNGKWPDACGTTDTWGEMKSRYYYKPGNLPTDAQQEFSRLNYTKDCEETKFSQCEMSSWASLRLYRIRNDNRNGCTQENAANCAGE